MGMDGYDFLRQDRQGKICNHSRVHPVSTFETSAVKALKKRQNQKYETKLTYSSGGVGNRGGQLRHRASPRSKSGQLPGRRLASRSRLYVRSDDGNLKPDARSTGQGETDHRSSPASDHRHSSRRDAKDEGYYGERDVADSSVAHTRAAGES